MLCQHCGIRVNAIIKRTFHAPQERLVILGVIDQGICNVLRSGSHCSKHVNGLANLIGRHGESFNCQQVPNKYAIERAIRVRRRDTHQKSGWVDIELVLTRTKKTVRVCVIDCYRPSISSGIRH